MTKDKLLTEDKDLTASDLQKAAGLSYRQLNSWDEKGILPESEREDDGWRKFSPDQAFNLLICKELRDRFGVPLDTLRLIQHKLRKDNFNNLTHTISLISDLGFTVCLLTDLKDDFIIDTDIEIASLMRAGLMRQEKSKDYIMLRLNPLVNKILSTLELPLIPSGDAIYSKLFELYGQVMVKDEAEFHLLSLVRSKDFRSITVHLKDGRIYQTDTFEELGEKVDGEVELIKLIKEKQYQSIAIDLTGGEIIRISRKSPTKYNKETGKP